MRVTRALSCALFLSCMSLWAQESVPACGVQLSPEAIFHMIPGLSNGVDQGGEHSCAGTGHFGLQYQCVEYVKRFSNAPQWHGNADTYYRTAAQKGLLSFPNGGSVPPAAGDILVFEGGSVGHVAVVTNATASDVEIIEQNWSDTGVATLPLTSVNGRYTMPPRGMRTRYTVLGWLRKPEAMPVLTFSRTDIATSSTTASITAADLRGNGKTDLIAIGNMQVMVLLGRGDGTFLPEVDYPADFPNSIATGDFNNDGIVDIVVAGGFHHTGLILLGNGDGTFRPVNPFPIGGNGSAVVAGDFNRDGNLDLAITNPDTSTVSILLGKGDGAFSAYYNIPAYQGLGPVVTADFNGDGKLDLAFANYLGENPYVSILLGEGNGHFSSRMDYSTGFFPASLATGDVNGDHHIDLIFTGGHGAITVLLGVGNGSFGPPTEFGATEGAAPVERAVGLADFNLDGKVDIAASNDDSDPQAAVFVLLGNGDGTFRQQHRFAAPFGPGPIAIGDFNGDGKPDIAVVSFLDSHIAVFLNTSH